MFHRILKPTKNQSFFLFGARGTGKSTFFETRFKGQFHLVNFLEEKWERRYSRDPDILEIDLENLKDAPEWIVLDEVQKVPKILDIVHKLIEKKNYKFILTGSSARKLRRNSINLLAGRAFNYQMFPLCQRELGSEFDLEETLKWGSLPKIYSLSKEDREEYLRSYCQTYLKEEILQEQIVRNGSSFRGFLEIAAQENGKTLNYSKISRDVGVDVKTIQSYFEILEDTLIGIRLPAFHRSVRKSVKLQPKFYLFDLGIKRAMAGELGNAIVSRSHAYGNAFEHFLVCEILRLNSYLRKDFSISHYQTTAGGEVDLVLHKANHVIAIEIKSNSKVDLTEVHKLEKVSGALTPNQIFYLSQDPFRQKVKGVECLHWKEFLTEFFV